MIHDRIMQIPAIYGAKNEFIAGTDTTNLVDGIVANLFFTAAAFSPIGHFHKIFLDHVYFLIVHQWD